MNKLNYIVSFLLLLLLVSSCKEDGYVRIDTLSKYGDTYFGGQVVPVWVGVDVNNLEKATYKWECDGGCFEGKTDVFRAAWVAPMEKGEYTVKCTVTCDGALDTRVTKMVVGEYFFDQFGVSSTNFTAKDVKTTYANGEVLVVGSKSNRQGLYVREIGDENFKAPFSFSYDVAWRKTYKNGTTPFRTWLYMVRIPDVNGVKNTKFIQEISLDFFPKAASGSANYVLSLKEYNVSYGMFTQFVASQGRLAAFDMTDGSKAEDGKGMKNIELSVNEDNTIIVKVNGEVILTSAAIREWETQNGISNVIKPSRAGFKIYDKCNMYIDNFYLKK